MPKTYDVNIFTYKGGVILLSGRLEAPDNLSAEQQAMLDKAIGQAEHAVNSDDTHDIGLTFTP